MGVDAQMFVRLNRDPLPQELQAIAAKLLEMDPGLSHFEQQDRLARVLDLSATGSAVGDDFYFEVDHLKASPGRLVFIEPGCRFHRADIIDAVAELVEKILPDGELFLGGDTGPWAFRLTEPIRKARYEAWKKAEER